MEVHLFAVAVVAFCLTVCSGTVSAAPSLNIYQAVLADPSLGVLASVLNSTTVSDYELMATMLQSPGNWSVFAPNDQAMAAGKVNPAHVVQTSNTLSYHIVGQRVSSFYLTANAPLFLETEQKNTSYVQLGLGQGQVVKVIVEGGQLFLVFGLPHQRSKVLSSVECTNGVLFTIDTVMTIPPAVTDIAISAGVELWLAAMTFSGLLSPLSARAQLTFFAPQDDVFESLGIGNLPTSTQSALLKYLIAPARPQHNLGVFYSTVLADQVGLYMLEGQALGVLSSQGNASGPLRLYTAPKDVANIVVRDIITSNGVLHVIDNVFAVPFNESNSIFENIQLAPQLSQIVQVLNQPEFASVKNMLDGPRSTSPVAVFLPTNTAQPSQLLALPSTLALQVLSYHVASASITEGFADPRGFFNSSLHPPMLSPWPQQLQMEFAHNDHRMVFGVPASANGSCIVHVHWGVSLSRNGYTYLTEKLLMPPGALDKLDLQAAQAQIYVDTLSAAGLLDSLLSLHSATIFVPADSVLRHTALACLSPTELRTFMEHHIVDELPFSHPFYVEQPAAPVSVHTEAGATINISSDARNITIQQTVSGVIKTFHTVMAPVLLSNGVMYVIDGILGNVPFSTLSMLDVIKSTPHLSTLSTLLAQPQYAQRFAFLGASSTAHGTWTFFAPDNTALAGVDTTNFTNTVNLLLYHMVNQSLDTFQLQSATRFLHSELRDSNVVQLGGLGQVIKVVPSTGSFKLATGDPDPTTWASPSGPGQCAVNGRLYTIDKVFTVPKPTAVAAQQAQLTSLLSAAARAQATQLLDTPRLTVFAPNDAAFTRDHVVTSMTADALADIVKLHAVSGAGISPLYSTKLAPGLVLHSLEGGSLTVQRRAPQGYVIQEGSGGVGEVGTLVGADILTSNGVIHIVDTVLPVPFDAQRTILDNVARVPRLTSSYSLLTLPANQAVAQILSSAGTYTAFLPSNSASPAPSASTPVHAWLYSVVHGPVVFGAQRAFFDSELQQPLLGANGRAVVQIDTKQSLSAPSAKIIFGVEGQSAGEAQIELSTGDDDQKGSNGGVYLIDKALQVPGALSPQLGVASTFCSLVQTYMGDVLTAHQATIFAPSNAAMAQFDLNALTAEEVVDFIRYHVTTRTYAQHSPLYLWADVLANPVVLPTHVAHGFHNLSVYTDFAVLRSTVTSVFTDPSAPQRKQTIVANVTVANVLLANGVMHVVSKPLGGTTHFPPAEPTHSGGNKLPGGQIAAIVICLLIVVFFGAFLLLRYVRRPDGYSVQLDVISPTSEQGTYQNTGYGTLYQ